MGLHVSQSTVLLRRWHSGDESALQQLLVDHLPWIQARVRARLGDALRAKEETQDIVQDALMEFLRYGPRFELENEAQLRFLLGRIAENVLRDAHDFYQRRRRQAAREEPLGNDSVLLLDPSAREATRPDEALERKQWRAWVRLALELLELLEPLEPLDRDVIVMRQWDELDFATIGERLGLEETAARMRFHRALPRLAAKIEALRRGQFDVSLESDAPSTEQPAAALPIPRAPAVRLQPRSTISTRSRRHCASMRCTARTPIAATASCSPGIRSCGTCSSRCSARSRPALPASSPASSSATSA